VVAIAAGQMAQVAAVRLGPTGPFYYSPLFLIMATVFVLLFWSKEGEASKKEQDKGASSLKKEKPTMKEGTEIIMSDPKILCLGIVQSLFEASMYVFVICWSPLMKMAIQSAYGESTTVPYGKIFSCFMAACMLGSTVFGFLSGHQLRIPKLLFMVTGIASLSLALPLKVTSKDASSIGFGEVIGLYTSFLAFEACVGMYFPSIGTLRGALLPDAHRSIIMTLFAVPQNLIVVVVFLLLDHLGHKGSLALASFLLGLAAMTMLWLDYRMLEEEQRRKHIREKFRTGAMRARLLGMAISGFTDCLKKSKTRDAREVALDRSSRESYASFGASSMLY